MKKLIFGAAATPEATVIALHECLSSQIDHLD